MDASTRTLNQSDYLRPGLAAWRLVERHPFLAVSLLYAGLWAVFSLWHRVPFASIETDGMEYIQTARTLFTPNWGYSSFHGLGYPAAIWLVHVFVNDWFVSAKVTSGIAGLAFLVASLALAETLLNRRAVLLAGLVVVTNFFYIAYSAIAMSDMLAAALGMASLCLIIRGSKPARYALAAVLIGLAAVTHYQYFGLYLAGVFVVLLEPALATRLRALTWFFGIIVLAAVPLLVSNWQAFGSLFANSNFANLGHWFYSAEQARQVHSWGDAIRLIASDPRYFVLGYLKSVAFDLPVYLPHVFAFGMLLAPGGWALLLNRKENRARVLVALGFGLVYILVTGLSWLTEARFWLYLIPFIAIGCAFLMMRLATGGARAASLIVLFILLGNGAIATTNLPRYIKEQAPEFERAGLAIRDTAPQDAVILVTQPQIAYFAERPAVLLRDAPQTWGALPGVLSQNKVEYIVMDDRYGSGHYPELTKLLEPESLNSAFPDWKLVYYEDQIPRIAVYRVMQR